MIKLQGPMRAIQNDERLKVERKSGTQWIDGKLSPGQTSAFSIRANVQPLDGRQLLLVPEGDRTKEQYWLYTATEVRLGDQVVRCGVNFQIQQVENWGSFFMARIMRIDVGPNASCPP